MTEAPTLESLGIPIMQPSQSPDRKFAFLIQGPPNSGKTWFAATLPKTFFLMADRNTGSLDKYEGIIAGETPVRDWTHWDEVILPACEARLFPGESLCLDTLGPLGTSLEVNIGGSIAMTPEGREWARYSNAIATRLDRFVLCRYPKDDHPGYNICVNVHERTKSDKKGGVIKIGPKIAGQEGATLGRFFDCHFIAQSRRGYVEVGERVDGESVKTEPTEEHILHTVPPDDTYDCGDKMSGKGVFQKLPAEVPNDFNELLRLWRDGTAKPTTKET